MGNSALREPCCKSAFSSSPASRSSNMAGASSLSSSMSSPATARWVVLGLQANMITFYICLTCQIVALSTWCWQHCCQQETRKKPAGWLLKVGSCCSVGILLFQLKVSLRVTQRSLAGHKESQHFKTPWGCSYLCSSTYQVSDTSALRSLRSKLRKLFLLLITCHNHLSSR